MIISAFLIIFKLPLAILGIIMIIWGLGWTFNHAGVSTLLTDLPKEFLNEAASLNSSVRFLSGGIGVALSGLIMQKSFVGGFLTLGVCLILLLMFSRKLLLIK
jgi:predicted MFS family arabinose efflux permease